MYISEAFVLKILCRSCYLLRPTMPTKSVMKYHLKNSDAVASLKKRASSRIKSRHFAGLDEHSGGVPNELLTFVSPIRERMEAVKAQLLSKEPVLKQAVQGLREEQLKVLSDLLDPKKTKLNTEEIVMIASENFLPDINLINRCIPALEKMKYDIVETFSNCVAEEFNTMSNGDAVFDKSGFKTVVDGELRFREGYRRRVSEGTDRGICYKPQRNML